MFNTISLSKPFGNTLDVLDELIEYTDYHFKTEEEYFDRFNYPDSENHKIEHEKFVNQVLDFKKSIEGKDKLSNLEIFTFLRDWVHKHILKSDKKYHRYFKQNKVDDFLK